MRSTHAMFGSWILFSIASVKLPMPSCYFLELFYDD